MFWTLELASHLEEAPWPATKDELIDYSIRSGAPIEVVENLQELEDEGGDIYESLEDIWPDYPSQEDFFFNEDEYWSKRLGIGGMALHFAEPEILNSWFCFGRIPFKKIYK